jgi:hypothetical protein
MFRGGNNMIIKNGFFRIVVICVLFTSTFTSLVISTASAGPFPNDQVVADPGEYIMEYEVNDQNSDLYITDMSDWLVYDSDRDGLSDNYEQQVVHSAKFQSELQSPVIYDDADDPLYVNDRSHRIPRSNIHQGDGYVWGRVNLYNIGFDKEDFESENIFYLTDGKWKNYAYVMTTTVIDALSPTLYFNFKGEDKYQNIETSGKSDMYDPDTDNDGDWDGVEVWSYYTNPIDADTDNDWVRDPFDVDPLEDLKIYVEIKEILEQESPDGSGNFGDYFVRIYIDGKLTTKGPHMDGGNGHTYPGSTFINEVADTKSSVDIKLQLWDYDPEPYKPDEHMDIARHGRDVNVEYNLRTGMWDGADDSRDYMEDRNGLGHTSGLEDDVKGSDEADIWFDIYQSDDDDDRLPYWQELNVLNTDPTYPDDDTDRDGMPDWWEVRFGLQRTDSSDADFDPDFDHLSNAEEYDLDTDPQFFEPNLIISMEWDASQSYMNDYVVSMRRASDFLWDVTDGYMYFKHVQIYDNKERWGDADIRVLEGTANSQDDENWPRAGGDYLQDTGFIKMPEWFDHDNHNGGSGPKSSDYYRTIVHEWGHYGLLLKDEYIGRDSSNPKYPNEDDWNGVHYKAECDPSIMDSSHTRSELCTPSNHDPDGDTEQTYLRGESCWETFYKTYRNHIWFDLDDDDERDDAEFYQAYEAKSGPDMFIEGGYTTFEVVNK